VIGAIKDLYNQLMKLVSEAHSTQKKIEELEKKIDYLLVKQQELERKNSQECQSTKIKADNKSKKK
jgi:hypothetical protein